MTESSEEIKIREAIFDNASDIYKLGKRSFVGYSMEDWTFSLVAELLEEFPRFSLVAIKNRKIVGFLLGKPYERSKIKFYIYWVAVDPSMRGKGIATNLIAKITEIAKRYHYKQIIIDTTITNDKMIGIIEKNGFDPIQETIYFSKNIILDHPQKEIIGTKEKIQNKSNQTA